MHIQKFSKKGKKLFLLKKSELLRRNLIELFFNSNVCYFYVNVYVLHTLKLLSYKLTSM